MTASKMNTVLNEVFQAAPKATQDFMSKKFVSSVKRPPSTILELFRSLLGDSLRMTTEGFELGETDAAMPFTAPIVCARLNKMVNSRSKEYPTKFDWAESVKQRLSDPNILTVSADIVVDTSDSTSWLGLVQAVLGEELVVAVYDDEDEHFGLLRGFVPMKASAFQQSE